MEYSSFNLEALDSILKRIQTDFLCNQCKRMCSKKWYNMRHNICFLCTHFDPKLNTYISIMRETEWFFMKSTEDDWKTYYQEYVAQVSEWCAVFNIETRVRSYYDFMEEEL
jgi:hypothetical protein